MSSDATPARKTGLRAAAGTPRRRRDLKTKVFTPYTMLAPGIVLFALFMALPIAYTIVMSFQKVKIIGLGLGSAARAVEFAGLSNYADAVSDPEFGASVLRVLLYGLVLIPTMLGLALVFALLLDSARAKATRFSRIAIFLPYAVPAVISSLLWGFLYLPGVSPFLFVLGKLHLSQPNILGPNLIIFAVANIALWGGVGFNMIVIYTSLRAIPTDIYEAARIDGATEFQIAWRIKIPIVVPSLIMTALFSIIATLQVFAEPTTLRPLTNSLSTSWTPLMKVYRDAFIRNDVYSAAATSVLIALGTFVLSFVFLRIVQRRAFGQED
jgi:multiple sugar transport system permease protein